MWENLKEKITAEKLICGLEINLKTDDQSLFYGIILERLENSVKIHRLIAETDNWKDVVNAIPANIPCAVSVTGKGIFQKNIKDRAQFEDNKLVNSILPTVKPEEFYWQLQSTRVTKELSVIKKELLDSLLERMVQLRLNVQTIFLGYASVSDYISILPEGLTELNTAAYILTIKIGRINDVQVRSSKDKNSETDLQIGDERFNGKMFFSYCAALSYILKGPFFQPGIKSSLIDSAVLEQHYKEKFKLASAGLLVCTLLILLINFLVFDYYYSKTSDIKAANDNSKEDHARYVKLKSMIDAKEKFFLKSGWLKGYRISLISDEIAESVPDSMVLTNLSLFPVIEHNQGFKTDYHFVNDTLFISGTCSGPSILNSWISELKKIDRVAMLKLSSYQFNNRSELAEFKIEGVLR